MALPEEAEVRIALRNVSVAVTAQDSGSLRESGHYQDIPRGVDLVIASEMHPSLQASKSVRRASA